MGTTQQLMQREDRRVGTCGISQLLEAENAGLKKAVFAKKVKTADLRYTWKTLYYVGEHMYLEAPPMEEGEERASPPPRNVTAK